MTNGDHEDRHAAVDVGSQRIARVYAEALLAAADRRGAVDEAAEELGSLVEDAFGADPRLEAFLASAAVDRRHKAEFIRSAIEKQGASPIFVNFLLVLNEHERLGLLRPILAAYRDLLDQRARRVRVQVRSAVPLPDDQKDRLRRELHETFHMEPVLEAEVDPGLLGGMVVRVGDWVYDASVRTRLNNLRNELIEKSNYEIQSRRDRFRSDAGD